MERATAIGISDDAHSFKYKAVNSQPDILPNRKTLVTNKCIAMQCSLCTEMTQ
ncbi:hypothetical protein CCACVL1_03268 [Corchorus capsularis]|uniref:Uncharacterized protein n=1 Tax=Corchorus capsularis TaxID=210143 RepID=A0A1R3K1D1_COCAP|nr:hypothetical protein CCACVL1_03268 [Corchorus capsularis]